MKINKFAAIIAAVMTQAAYGAGAGTVPQGATFQTGSGTATVSSYNGNAIETIDTTPGVSTGNPNGDAVINWSSFDVGQNNAVNFTIQNSNSIVVNVDQSGAASKIMGSVGTTIAGGGGGYGTMVFANPAGVYITGAMNAQHVLGIANTLDEAKSNVASGLLYFDSGKNAPTQAISANNMVGNGATATLPGLNIEYGNESGGAFARLDLVDNKNQAGDPTTTITEDSSVNGSNPSQIDLTGMGNTSITGGNLTITGSIEGAPTEAGTFSVNAANVLEFRNFSNQGGGLSGAPALSLTAIGAGTGGSVNLDLINSFLNLAPPSGSTYAASGLQGITIQAGSTLNMSVNGTDSLGGTQGITVQNGGTLNFAGNTGSLTIPTFSVNGGTVSMGSFPLTVTGATSIYNSVLTFGDAAVTFDSGSTGNDAFNYDIFNAPVALNLNGAQVQMQNSNITAGTVNFGNATSGDFTGTPTGPFTTNVVLNNVAGMNATVNVASMSTNISGLSAANLNVDAQTIGLSQASIGMNANVTSEINPASTFASASINNLFAPGSVTLKGRMDVYGGQFGGLTLDGTGPTGQAQPVMLQGVAVQSSNPISMTGASSLTLNQDDLASIDGNVNLSAGSISLNGGSIRSFDPISKGAVSLNATNGGITDSGAVVSAGKVSMTATGTVNLAGSNTYGPTVNVSNVTDDGSMDSLTTSGLTITANGSTRGMGSYDLYPGRYLKGFNSGVASVNTQSYYNNGYKAGVASVDTNAYYQDGYKAGMAAALKNQKQQAPAPTPAPTQTAPKSTSPSPQTIAKTAITEEPRIVHVDIGSADQVDAGAGVIQVIQAN